MEWAKVIEAGAMIGQRPDTTLSQTLPELKLAIRGWQRSQGIDPDSPKEAASMSHERLLELVEKYSKHEHS